MNPDQILGFIVGAATALAFIAGFCPRIPRAELKWLRKSYFDYLGATEHEYGTAGTRNLYRADEARADEIFKALGTPPE